MRVLFSSTRGTGHLLPLLPYAKALVAKGHEVLVAGPGELREPLLGAGLPHAPFGHPGDESLAPFWARLKTVPAEEQAAIFIREIFAGANSRAAYPSLLETVRTWRPQLIVRDSVEFAALVAAEVSGVPHVRVAVHQWPMEQNVCALAAAPVDVLRELAGLVADDGASLRAEPIFTAFPESFEGPMPSGSWRVHRVAPALAAPPTAGAGFEPDRDGLPLVYITFGTIASTLPEGKALYKIALEAVAQLPVRALVTTGRGFDVAALGVLPANVRVEAWVPQAEVLHHAAALVCHGGAGTVLGGLAAGVPQVVVPVGADQPFNAQSVASLGAGLALPKPDTEALRSAIQRLLNEPEFRRSARAVAAEMAALPSMDTAVNALLQLASPGTSA